MATIRLTVAQALVRYITAQNVVLNDDTVPYFSGAWAIFGHGNVAGLGEALYAERKIFPTYRAHNEQTMAHAAIAYAKAYRRQRAMVCTTSIGPGATNMVTAAALAHVNRLPVLFLPGDVFAGRGPDPVLQQIESSADGTISANDCFRPVSSYFDRITRPEQILQALPRAMATLISEDQCGPVTLALCQDVQAEAYGFPVSFFEPRIWRRNRMVPDDEELAVIAALIRQSKKPLAIAGGGVLYSCAEQELAAFVKRLGIPVAETQAGKSAMNADDPNNLGAIGVTGSSAANMAAQAADLIIGIGTRLQDFTTGSRGMINAKHQKLVQINVNRMDAYKHNANPMQADARLALVGLTDQLGSYAPHHDWTEQWTTWRIAWNEAAMAAVKATNTSLPSDAQVVGAVNRSADKNAIVVCAAGGLPGELHKLWRAGKPGGYHVEYGYSCMGYEIAGGLGVKMASGSSDVYVMVGDGSYLMANSEIATSVGLGQKLIIVVLDNCGFGCINRLQRATGGASFNNLLSDVAEDGGTKIDFAAHARSLGAQSEIVSGIAELEAALERAKASPTTYVIALSTDPAATTEAGGHWWDVVVPEVSERAEVSQARKNYDANIEKYRK